MFRAAIVGVYSALHSSLFMVRVLEVNDQPADAPLDSKEVIALAAVELDKKSLFALNLEEIQTRLMKNHWVRGVILTKRFPQTLAIQVIYRQPIALMQGTQGLLKYVDADGSLFGPVTLRGRADLPVIHGLPLGAAGERLLARATKTLQVWSQHSWKTANQVSQVTWDEEEGISLWIAFEPSYRVSVVLGPEWEPEATPVGAPGGEGGRPEAAELFARIDSVLQYSVAHSVPVRQIFADAHKKIVVRTARRS
jgi:hypothetical protein